MRKRDGKSLEAAMRPTGAVAGGQEAVLRRRLLNRLAALYAERFQALTTGKKALNVWGLTDESLWKDFRVGYTDGALAPVLPEGGEVREALTRLGFLDAAGVETFTDCVVFPWFDENDDCVGMAGVRVQSGEWVHLPGPRVGVWNLSALRRSRSLILAANILDALILYQAGFRDVTALWGSGGWTDDHGRMFQRHGTKEVYLTFEPGEGVEKGLADEEVAVYRIGLPKSVSDFFGGTERAVQVFEGMLAEANPQAGISSSQAQDMREEGFERTATGFVVQWGKRRYEVKAVQKEGVRLRVTLKAQEPGEKRFMLDVFDLYSERGRQLLSKASQGHFKEKAGVIGEDVEKLLELAEGYEPTSVETRNKAPEMGKEEREEALALLHDPALMDRILSDFEACGLAGEEGNKLTGYLCAVSRKLEEPLAVLIQSRSAAGKSTLQEAILRFIPPEDVEKYTRLTGQALFYKDESGLSHKLLAIEEEAGAREAGYSIRNLQSSKYLSIATTEKDPVTGKMRAVEYRVKGPVALMLTTTAVDMDFETQNRFLTLTIDESKAMTERILEAQREGETLAGLGRRKERERVERVHQNAQRLLRPLAVVNPYAPKLAFPATTLRARRDHKKYLGLIRVIAFLHQYQREVKVHEGVEYIEVEPGDIERANRLAGEVLGRTLDEVSAPGRALLSEIRRMVGERGKGDCREGEYRFTRRDIRAFTGWSDFQVKTHLGELVGLEYLGVVAGRKGQEYVYELNGERDREGEEKGLVLGGLACPGRVLEGAGLS